MLEIIILMIIINYNRLHGLEREMNEII